MPTLLNSRAVAFSPAALPPLVKARSLIVTVPGARQQDVDQAERVVAADGQDVRARPEDRDGPGDHGQSAAKRDRAGQAARESDGIAVREDLVRFLDRLSQLQAPPPLSHAPSGVASPVSASELTTKPPRSTAPMSVASPPVALDTPAVSTGRRLPR